MVLKKRVWIIGGILAWMLVHLSIGFGGRIGYTGDAACYSKKVVHERWFNLTPWHRLPLGTVVTVDVTRARRELPIFAGEEPNFPDPFTLAWHPLRYYGTLTRPLNPYEAMNIRMVDENDAQLEGWDIEQFGDGNIWIYYYAFNDDFYDFIQQRFTSAEDQRWLQDELFVLHRIDGDFNSYMPWSANGQPRNIGMIFWKPEAFDQRWYDVLTWNAPLRDTPILSNAKPDHP